MLEIVSGILVIIAFFTLIFVLIGFVVVRFRERNLPQEEKARRSQMRSGGISKTHFRVLLIVRLGVLGLLAGIVIVSFLQAREKYDQQFEPPTVSETEQSTRQETPSEVVNTSDWQTYRNDEFGFKVDWPRVYENNSYCAPHVVTSSENEPLVFIGPIIIRKIETEESLNSYVDEVIQRIEENPQTSLLSRTNINFDGREAIQVHSSFCGASCGEPNDIYVVLDSGILKINYDDGILNHCPFGSYELPSQVAEQILPTFRFVEQVKANFDYPSEWGELRSTGYVGTFERRGDGGSASFAAENELIKSVFYHEPTGQLAYVTQEGAWECSGDFIYKEEKYKAETLYMYENGESVQYYQTPDPGNSCIYGRLAIRYVWFMENPNYLAVSLETWEWSELQILSLETKKNILDGYEIWWPAVIWSPDKNTLTLISSLNEFGGEGGEALFVSDYGNPNILNEVIRIPNKFFLERQIKDVEFQENEMVTFTLSHEQGVTNYEYDVQQKQLSEVK